LRDHQSTRASREVRRESPASLAISDSEFSAVQDGLALNGVVTGVIVIAIF